MGEIRYDEDSIQTLDPLEHARLHPGMYIERLDDGSSVGDDIHVFFEEVLDNSVDRSTANAGKIIDVKISDNKVEVRDYGRGIPLGKIVDVVSKMSTGGKYDSRVFKKSIGLNEVGTKAINVFSSYFKAESVRDNQTKSASFERGIIKEESPIEEIQKRRKTNVAFIPDSTIFKNLKFRSEYVVRMFRDYVYLNPGLTTSYNGEKYYSESGLKDLLTEGNNEENFLYPIIHLEGEDIEVAISHSKTQYSEEYYSFVNEQNTTQGGTHLDAFEEVYIKIIRDFYKKNFDPSNVRKSIIAGSSIKAMELVFESQTKTKLGSTEMGKGMPSVRTYISDFVTRHLDGYLHKNNEVADAILRKIVEARRRHEDLAGIRKLAKERAKRANLHNKRLNDRRIHLTDTKDRRNLQNTLFITEGDLASDSITKSRNVDTQMVFSLRGKPLNIYGMTKEIVYENEEFNLLQAALNTEDSMDDLCYNNTVIVTDADIDGMHIRLLLTTFLSQFFPEITKERHLYILQTPLFRVRNKNEKIYCYDEEEKQAAIAKPKGKPEVTRFKGPGEISPNEFKNFIGEDVRLDPVMLDKTVHIKQPLDFYTGKNAPGRQGFIINNLKAEIDSFEQRRALQNHLQDSFPLMCYELFTFCCN